MADEHVSDVASSDEACSDELKVSKGSNKKWNDKNTTSLIDLLEERICLLDMSDDEYTKRKVRELAYKEIAENLHSIWTVPEIKTKINNLRAQLGRELKKAKKTKSGQSTDDSYKSSWCHWEIMQFLVPQMKSGTTKDTIDLESTYIGNDQLIYDSDEAEEGLSPRRDRSAKLQSNIWNRRSFKYWKDVQTRWRWPNRRNPKKNTSAFAQYVEEKLD